MRSVKHAVIGGVVVTALLALGTVNADAASSPLPPAPVPSWEGFYLGADLGYGMGVGQVTASGGVHGGAPADSAFDFLSAHGGIGGVLGGYNHMIAPRWLLGVEGDISWPDIEHNTALVEDGFNELNVQLVQKTPAYSLRGRIGYLMAPETLVYATGGWAWSQLTLTVNAPSYLFSQSGTNWFDGPQVGAGIETMVAPGWIGRLEYLYTLYPSQVIGTPGIAQVRPDIAVGRVGLIHSFGSNASAAPWDSQPVQPSWNGFYVGGAIGGGVGSAKVESDELPGSAIDGVGTPGVFPTFLGGYNLRAGPRWVLGVESEIEPAISTADFRLGWTAALRGRLGYLLTPATMLYGTAGELISGFETTSLFQSQLTVPGQRLSAAEFGVGIETALTDHWAARFEYQYVFGTTLYGNLVASGEAVPFTANLQVQYAKLGLVYMLDGH